jgi:GntR family transcriptional regulator, galactonate operon transcriptional repressor
MSSTDPLSVQNARREKSSRPLSGSLPLDTVLTASNLANFIGRDIVAGVFEENSLLPNEAVMRARYAVSRTALREAYSKLTAKGLVSARPKVGTSVRARTNWNMLDQDVLVWHLQTVPAEEIASDLYELRRMIEPGAAELAAEIRTQEDMEKIDAAFEKMKTNSTVEADLVEADFGFHLAILNATRNPFINAFSALIKAAMVSTFELSWRGAEVIKEQRLAQHGEVAEAIRAQTPAVARKRMETLLDDSIEDVSEALVQR